MNNKTECSLPPEPIVTCRCQASQNYGHLIATSELLSKECCKRSANNLNQLLADAMCIRDMYNKHRWQANGPKFNQLHEFFGDHSSEQSKIIDTIAERIATLGGVCISMASEVAEITTIPLPPKNCECPESQLTRLLQAHEITMKEARFMSWQASKAGDIGTHHLLVNDVIRTNGRQSRLVSGHLDELVHWELSENHLPI